MTLINDIDAKIYLAIKTHLDTMPGGYQVFEPSDILPTSADTPFLIIQDVRLDVNRRFVGSDAPDVHTGLFNLSIMTPLKWAYTQTLGVVGDIRDHFPKGEKMTYDDTLVTVDMVPQINGNPYRDGAFYRVPVSVRWRCSG